MIQPGRNKSVLFFCTSLAACYLFCISAFLSCTDQKKSVNQNTQQSPDTAAIHSRLRAYDKIPPEDTILKDAEWKSILADVIEMKYNDKACALLSDMGRYFADRGQFDSSLHYYNLARG